MRKLRYVKSSDKSDDGFGNHPKKKLIEMHMN